MTCSEIGIKLLNNIRNVRRLNAKFCDVLSKKKKNCNKNNLYLTEFYKPKYQSEWFLLQTKLNIEQSKHIANNIPNKRRICILVNLSTLDLFNGAVVEFRINLVSWPVYITIPKIHEVLRNIAPLSIIWSGPKGSALEYIFRIIILRRCRMLKIDCKCSRDRCMKLWLLQNNSLSLNCLLNYFQSNRKRKTAQVFSSSQPLLMIKYF